MTTIRSLEDGLKAEARESLTRLSGIKGDGPQVRCCPLEIEYEYIYIYECKIDNVVNVNYNQLQMLYNPSIHVYDINRQRGRERERETESCFFLHAPQSHPPHIVGGATVHSLSSNIIEPSSSCGF